MTAYQQQPIPETIKYFALGFVFLTLAGERQFEEVVLNAVIRKTAGKSPPPPGSPPSGP